MAYFEAAYHYNKRHNALEDAAWIDLLGCSGGGGRARKACYVMNFKHLTLAYVWPCFSAGKNIQLDPYFFFKWSHQLVFVLAVSQKMIIASVQLDFP